MSYDTAEASLSAGRPIDLYEFRRGGTFWRYVNADEDYELDGAVYTATAISDDGRRQTGEASADELVITGPWNLSVTQQFRGIPPSEDVRVIIRSVHEGEPEAYVEWSGVIVEVRKPQPGICRIVCNTFSSTFSRMGLRMTWERGCSNALGDQNCKVNLLEYAVPGEVISLTATQIEVGEADALPDAWFDGGYIEWELEDGNKEQRGIISHEGGLLTLLGGTDGIALGLGVTAFPGCVRTIAVCHTKFANSDNYGGHPHLPGKSPFDGTPVFY